MYMLSVFNIDHMFLDPMIKEISSHRCSKIKLVSSCLSQLLGMKFCLLKATCVHCKPATAATAPLRRTSVHPTGNERASRGCENHTSVWTRLWKHLECCDNDLRSATNLQSLFRCWVSILIIILNKTHASEEFVKAKDYVPLLIADTVSLRETVSEMNNSENSSTVLRHLNIHPCLSQWTSNLKCYENWGTSLHFLVG